MVGCFFLSRIRYVVFLSVFFSVAAHAGSTTEGSYRWVDLQDFFNNNHVSSELAEKKHRLMFKPEAIQFDAVLKSRPESGRFSLVYEALALWQSASDEKGSPKINHSIFVGTLDDGPVLGMYLSDSAVEYLSDAPLDKPMRFYAVHIYNYAGGPRMVVLAANPVEEI